MFDLNEDLIAEAAAKKLIPIYFDGVLGRRLKIVGAPTRFSGSRVMRGMNLARKQKEKSDSGMHVHTKQTPTVLKIIMPHLKVDLSGTHAYAALSRIGIRNFSDLLKAHDAFYSKARKEEIKNLFTDAQLKKFMLAFKSMYDLRARTKATSRSSGTDAQIALTNANNMIYALVKIYAFYAAQMCSILKKEYSKYGVSILAHGMFGKTLGAKLPAGFADAFKAGKKLAGTKATKEIDITKLKPLSFKKDSGHAIVNQLPDLFEAYTQSYNSKKGGANPKDALKLHRQSIKDIRAQMSQHYKEGKQSAYLKASKQLTKSIRQTYLLKNDVRLKKSKGSIEANKALYKKVGPEMYDFFRLVIPALKSKRVSDFLVKGNAKAKESKYKSEIRTMQSKLRMARHGGRGMRPKSPALIARETAAINAKIKVLKIKLKSNLAGDPVVATWMLPYVGTGVSIKAPTGKGRKVILDRGLLAHRLVTRANAGKLKAGDIELTVELDAHDARLLALGGVSRVIDACGGSSIKAFNSVFKNLVKELKPKVFTVEFSEASVLALETNTGKVTNARLLRLNNISIEQEKEIEKNYAKEIKAWNPLKEEASKYVKALSKSKEAVDHHYEVAKSSAAELKANRSMINKFLSKSHGVESLRVNKSWEVQPSKKLATVLKNIKDSSTLKIIKNVFHGTSRQTGSIILSRGFKIQGTQVTARAMGDVLYVAPNADKSAQYMKIGGSFQGMKSAGTSVTGMILMGDIIVSGEPTHATAGSNSGFRWTRMGSFKTEEIGLTNPNSQFIIRKAMIVTMVRSNKIPVRRLGPPAMRKAMKPGAVPPKGIVTKFETAVSLTDSDYKTAKKVEVKTKAKAKPKVIVKLKAKKK